MKKKDLKQKSISPVRLDELAAEKALMDPLLAADEGAIEFSDAFLDRMHDEIMAKIEDKEILPEPKPWQKIRWQVYAKFAVGITTTMLCAVSISLAYTAGVEHKMHQAAVDRKNASYERLLKAALKSPDHFSTMVTASLGQDDFFVDVASQNSDHLSLGDLDGIMGLSTKKN